MERLDAWLADNAEEIAGEIRPGASDAQIAQAEQELGIAFPPASMGGTND